MLPNYFWKGTAGRTGNGRGMMQHKVQFFYRGGQICLCFVHLLSASALPFGCDNCEYFVSALLVYPYLSTMALCSGHSTHRQLQYRSSKANLSCLPVNIIVTDTPAIPSHRMNDPSVALKNGHPTSTLSQLVAIDYPPKLLAFCYAFACTIMHPLARF